MIKAKKSQPQLVAAALISLGMLGRLALILSERVNFNSDEAVVGLMARHILQGQPIPTFFYGQAYFGSLSALTSAGAFALLGESLRSLRLVQWLVYGLTLLSAYVLAYTISERWRVAFMTLFLLAIPTLLGTLYTTISIGGYNELVLISNLIFLLGWRVTVGGRRAIWEWGALGFCMGLGWWIHAGVVVPIGVVGLLGLRYFRLNNRRLYLVAGLLFFVGSAPWWAYNFQHDWAALEFLTTDDPFLADEYQADDDIPAPLRALGLLVLGVSALYGFRFPWDVSFQSGIFVSLAALVYLVLLTDMLTRAYRRILRRDTKTSGGLNPRAGDWVLLCLGLMLAVFSFSSFSDSTGRYLVPILFPVSFGVALGLEQLGRKYKILMGVGLAILLAFQGTTVYFSAISDDGIDAYQAEPSALFSFLDEQGLHYGYTDFTNSYRLSFLSAEQYIFDSSLPYYELGYRGSNRYPPYVEAVAEAETIFWLTQDFPLLDRVIQWYLADAEINYQVAEIGGYRVYYDFSERVTPYDFNLTDPRPFKTLPFYDEVCGAC